MKSRLININFDKIYCIRNFFEIKFSKAIWKDTLLFNIDEASINRNTKLLYSWKFKGIPTEIRNTWFNGSVTMIIVICSDGSWINFMINETIGSSSFGWFLKIMYYWLQSNKLFNYSKEMIILDNCGVHKSRTTKSWLDKMNY